MVVGLLGDKSPDSNRFTLVTPKSENDVRLQAKLGNQNPTGLPVGAVRFSIYVVRLIYKISLFGTDICTDKSVILIQDLKQDALKIQV